MDVMDEVERRGRKCSQGKKCKRGKRQCGTKENKGKCTKLEEWNGKISYRCECPCKQLKGRYCDNPGEKDRKCGIGGGCEHYRIELSPGFTWWRQLCCCKNSKCQFKKTENFGRFSYSFEEAQSILP